MTTCEQCGMKISYRKKINRNNKILYVCHLCVTDKNRTITTRKIDEMQQRLNILESRFDTTLSENEQLKRENEEMKTKKKFPCWIRIKEGRFGLTSKRLEEVLDQIKPISTIIQIDYGLNDMEVKK